MRCVHGPPFGGGGGEDSAVLWGRPIVEGAGEGHQEKLVMP